VKYFLNGVTSQVRFEELTNADPLSVFSHPESLKVVGKIYLVVAIGVSVVSDSDGGACNEKVPVTFSAFAH
jgi:hypothetical protein